jgi:UDP-2-acetamido-3-amino-2,3-dideoxy-glucuronate N-acetyltransferase
MKTHETSVIDKTAKIGDGTAIWHWTHVRENVSIGKNCVIGQNCYIGPGIKIGNNVKIQNNVSIYEPAIIEDDVFCGPSMVFTNVINPRSEVNRKSEFKKTFLKKGCSVGANATIICGSTLGEYCMVGAGSVVTKDVKAYSCVVGNPAKRIYWISRFGEKLDFGSNNILENKGYKYSFFDEQEKVYSEIIVND